MGRRGPEPDHARREAFARLISEGVPSLRASRLVGIDPHGQAVAQRAPRHVGRSCGRLAARDHLHRPCRQAVLTALPVRGRAPAPGRPAPGEAHDARDRRPHGQVAVRHQPRARPRCRRVRTLSTVRGAPPCAGAAPRPPAQPPGPRPRAAGLGDGRLQARWSPEQVSRGLRTRYPDQPERWLCAETIYQAVYRPDLGGLPRELPGRVLRHRRRHRVPRRQAQARRSGPVTGMTLIHERPAEVLDRAVARPLGGRPHHGRGQPDGNRHARRADHPVRPAGTPARREARLGDGPRRRRRGPRCPAPAPATDPDLGPGQGDGAATRRSPRPSA